jgi:hypothetical protein
MKCSTWAMATWFACALGVNLPPALGQIAPGDTYYQSPPPALRTAPVGANVVQNAQPEIPPIPAPEFDPRQEPPADPDIPYEYAEVEYDDEPFYLFPQDGWFKVHGWIAGGATFNGRRTPDRFNGPVTFNDRRNELMLNQLYGVIEREIDTEYGWDIGGRVDLLYGTDYIFTQSAGLETQRNFDPRWNSSRFYGLAMPQLFLEAGYGDFSVKVGHFYTIIGYEVVTAPDNFFYSHAYTMQYGEPFTHTGALATWNFNDNWVFTGGIVDGWDKWDPVSSRASFLGGATYTPDHEQYSLAFALITGDEDGADPPFEGNRTMYSIVFSYDVTENLQYVLQHDNGIQSRDGDGSVQWYGINQYLFYTINECWKAGLRAEWFRDDAGTRVAGVRDGNQTPGGHEGDFYQITAGMNWTPAANLIVRPEARWDWFDGVNAGDAPYAGRNSQFTAGIDAIFIW